MAEKTKNTQTDRSAGQVEKEKLESVKKADAAVKSMSDFTSPEVLYNELIASVKKYHPSTDISMIEKAMKLRERLIRIRNENQENHISFILYVLRSYLLTWNLTKKPSWQDFFMIL